MTKVEYHIISGKVIETRRCYLAGKPLTVRGTRKAGNSSARKIAANEREKTKRLGRILNCNFGSGFLFVTLKYSPARLPEDREAARKNAEKFLRKARSLHEKKTGQPLHYCMVTANWSPKHNHAARLHHHIVMDETSLDMLEQLWPHGEFHVRRVGNPADLTPLADYLCRNVHGLDAGQKTWTCNKGLDKPIFTEPKPVQEIDAIEPLPDTSVVDGYQITSDEGEIVGSYLRAICHAPIRVRGGQIILPKRGKKKYRPPLDISQLTDTDE